MAEVSRYKNVATRIVVPLINSSSRPAYHTGTLTNEAITAYSWQDGQAAASLTIAGLMSQLASTGLWELALLQAEMNPDSGADDYIIVKINADEIDEQTILLRIIPTPADLREINGDKTNGNNAILSLKAIDFDGGTGSQPAVNLKGGDTAPAAVVLESDTDVIHQTCKTAGGNVLVATAGSAAGDCYKLNAPADAGKALDLNGGPVTGKGLEASGGGADIDAQEISDIETKIGTPSDLGGGSTLADNAADMAGPSFNASTDSQEAISDAVATLDSAVGALPDAADNADAIWDEALSGHTGAGTAGKTLADVPDVDAIADGVWNEDITTHTTSDSAGKELQDTLADADFVDYSFERDVQSRHPDQKPASYFAGTGAHRVAVAVAQDINQNTETESVV